MSSFQDSAQLAVAVLSLYCPHFLPVPTSSQFPVTGQKDTVGPIRRVWGYIGHSTELRVGNLGS